MLSELRAQGWKYASLALAVLAVIAIGTALYFRGDSAISHSRAQQAESERDSARAEVNDLKAARDTEHRKAKEAQVIAAKYEDEKRAIETESARVVADLRAGNLRLRKLWEAQAATADLSRAVASTSQPDDQAADRAESASRIVRAAAECDAQVRGLQAVIEADRR